MNDGCVEQPQLCLLDKWTPHADTSRKRAAPTSFCQITYAFFLWPLSGASSSKENVLVSWLAPFHAANHLLDAADTVTEGGYVDA